MKRVNLASPVPRRNELPYSEFRYSLDEKIYLQVPETTLGTSVGDLIPARQSRRVFQPLAFGLVGELLWHSARTISIAAPSDSSRWQHRPAPSAGGRHPVDLLIIDQTNGSWRISLYDPLAHSLAPLKLNNPDDLGHFVDKVNHVIPVLNATLIWFGAQFDRTLSKYKDGESLVWRDAGALTMMICVVAEALKLNCCALGITGEPFLSKMLGSDEKVLGAGGILVGGR